jgi:hypothetical protein
MGPLERHALVEHLEFDRRDSAGQDAEFARRKVDAAWPDVELPLPCQHTPDQPAQTAHLRQIIDRSGESASRETHAEQHIAPDLAPQMLIARAPSPVRPTTDTFRSRFARRCVQVLDSDPAFYLALLLAGVTPIALWVVWFLKQQ